jgi:hypothetical protein
VSGKERTARNLCKLLQTHLLIENVPNIVKLYKKASVLENEAGNLLKTNDQLQNNRHAAKTYLYGGLLGALSPVWVSWRAILRANCETAARSIITTGNQLDPLPRGFPDNSPL